MKRVLKGNDPSSLHAWKVDNVALPQNLTYGVVHGSVKREVRSQMAREQGGLCAYTMIRFADENDCHIEHVCPQNQCIDETLSYSNMLACYPSDAIIRHAATNGTKRTIEYGAEKKGGGHISATNFISPVQADVETKFRYRADGQIEGIGNTAISTVFTLGLNSNELVELRHAVILARGLSRFSTDPITSIEARQVANEVLQRDETDRYAEFCLAIAHAAIEYADLEDAALPPV